MTGGDNMRMLSKRMTILAMVIATIAIAVAWLLNATKEVMLLIALLALSVFINDTTETPMGLESERKSEKKSMRILVGTDGSDQSMKAVEYAASLALKKDGEVLLVHVVAMDPRIPPSIWVTPEIEARDRKFIEELRKAAENMLNDIAKKLKEIGVNVRTRIEFGDPAEQILRIADDEEVDMIVLGVRGISRWKKILMGSVSEKVADEAKVPVMIVR